MFISSCFSVYPTLALVAYAMYTTAWLGACWYFYGLILFFALYYSSLLFGILALSVLFSLAFFRTGFRYLLVLPHVSFLRSHSRLH